MKCIALIWFFVTVSHFISVSSVLLDVTDGSGKKFATLRGTEETSENTKRPYNAFRSVHYAEMPSNATRFLVKSFDSILYFMPLCCKNYFSLLIASNSKSALSRGSDRERSGQQRGLHSGWRIGTGRLSDSQRFHTKGNNILEIHLASKFTSQSFQDNVGRLPVLFYIHGGAFSLGQALEYEPSRYMEKDIVLVEIQYRLGPLGEWHIRELIS